MIMKLMRQQKEHDLGTFEVKSGTLVVSDPCYDIDTWCMGVLENVRKGTWKATAHKRDMGDWGNRVAALAVYHSDLSLDELDEAASNAEPASFEVGVDSGQAGFFDEPTFKEEYPIPHPQTGRHEYDSYSYQRLLEAYSAFRQTITDCVGRFKGAEFHDTVDAEMEKLKRYLDPDRATATTDWYEVCCDITLSNMSAGTMLGGAVASSGFGDGGYTCYVFKDDQSKVVYAEIVFIGSEDE